MSQKGKNKKTMQDETWSKASAEFLSLCNKYGDGLSDYVFEEEKAVMTFISNVDAIFKKYPTWLFQKRIKTLPLQGMQICSVGALYFLCERFMNSFCKPLEVDNCYQLRLFCLTNGVAELIEHNLASKVLVNSSINDATRDAYVISVWVASRLFGGQRQLIRGSEMSSFGTYYRHQDIKPKDLHFPESMTEQINRIFASTSEGKYKAIVSKIKSRGLRDGLAMLFYGPPGTGKTELARQIAARNHLDLFSVDSAKMDGTRFGDGPRALRDMFRAFAYCSAISDCPPIMFWDEADAILSKRVTVSYASDREANTEINIILEELNHFSGILIAATNHMDNISSAMFRRFLFKVEFPIPDANTRAKIWKSKLPWLQDDEAHTIAERYSFSGGLMDNVATICLLESVLTGKNPPLSFILRQCEGQQVGAEKPGTKIGFKYNNKV